MFNCTGRLVGNPVGDPRLALFACPIVSATLDSEFGILQQVLYHII